MIARHEVRTDDGTNVLAFFEAAVTPADGGTIALDATVDPADLVLVHVDDSAAQATVIDAICGLADVAAGTREVLGHAWEALTVERANALRGAIGRVSTRPVFPSHMTVGESATLAVRYHGQREAGDIMAEAARLAGTFGLPGLPVSAPEALRHADRIRADCVRGLLGGPDLLLIDERRDPFPDDIGTALLNAARRVRMRGGAVVWLTAVRTRLSDRRFPATQCHELRDGRMRPVEAPTRREVG